MTEQNPQRVDADFRAGSEERSLYKAFATFVSLWALLYVGRHFMPDYLAWSLAIFIVLFSSWFRPSKQSQTPILKWGLGSLLVAGAIGLFGFLLSRLWPVV
jgi:hypothetical protein